MSELQGTRIPFDPATFPPDTREFDRGDYMLVQRGEMASAMDTIQDIAHERLAARPTEEAEK